jgi:hypothetical protein
MGAARSSNPALKHGPQPAKRHAMKQRILHLALAALFVTGCKATPPAETTAPAPQADMARPAMWKMADSDTTIYLLGTIHLLPKDLDWVTPEIEKAAQASAELVLEVPDVDDPQRTAQTFMSLALSPDLPPLAERLPENQRAGLASLIEKSGVPAIVLDRFETWAAAITLTGGMMKDLGVSADLGVERILSSQFKQAGKPVLGLETGEQQLGYFDALPEPAQRTFLTSLVEEQADMKTEFDKMLAAWSTGDVKAIAISFDDELRLSKELADVLIRKRNANWSEWLAKRMDKPGTLFVAVGAGHLAGDDSVQEMLEDRGLKVVRVQ